MKHQLTSSRHAISQHLELLEAAGLVRTRREGRSNAQLRVEPCGLSREVVAFGEVGR
jgi:DNA-binding transcriptional ArsR family regulator